MSKHHIKTSEESHSLILDSVTREDAERLIAQARAHCRRINPKADAVFAAVDARKRAEYERDLREAA